MLTTIPLHDGIPSFTSVGKAWRNLRMWSEAQHWKGMEVVPKCWESGPRTCIPPELLWTMGNSFGYREGNRLNILFVLGGKNSFLCLLYKHNLECIFISIVFLLVVFPRVGSSLSFHVWDPGLLALYSGFWLQDRKVPWLQTRLIKNPSKWMAFKWVWQRICG